MRRRRNRYKAIVCKKIQSRRTRLELELLEGRMLLSDGLAVGLAGAVDALVGPTDLAPGDEEPTPLPGDATPVGANYMLYNAYGGDWSDAEKSPASDEDDLMCWAATAANVLEWTGWGAVDGMGDADTLFQYFVDHWTDQGSFPECAWQWWFEGVNPYHGDDAMAQVDVLAPGFFLAETFEDYCRVSSDDAHAMQNVDAYLSDGCGVSLTLNGPGAHAITCWGFNYNAADPSEYYGIWVTDSDDDKGSYTPSDRLHYYEVSYSDGKWYVEDFSGDDGWFIAAVHGLEQAPARICPDLANAGASASWFSPHSVQAGEMWICQFTVENTGRTDAGVFFVDFYLSTNSYISTSDIFLGSTQVRGLEAGQWVGVGLAVPSFPSDVAARDYFVGVLIDSTGAVREASESNNQGVELSSCMLTVEPSFSSPLTYINRSLLLLWALPWQLDSDSDSGAAEKADASDELVVQTVTKAYTDSIDQLLQQDQPLLADSLLFASPSLIKYP